MKREGFKMLDGTFLSRDGVIGGFDIGMEESQSVVVFARPNDYGSITIIGELRGEDAEAFVLKHQAENVKESEGAK